MKIALIIVTKLEGMRYSASIRQTTDWNCTFVYPREAGIRYGLIQQEDQHPLTAQRAANFRLSFLQ